MKSTSIVRPSSSRLLDVAVYLTLAILMVVSLLVFPETLTRVLIFTLCLLFGVVYRFGYYAIRTPHHAALYFTLQTFLLTCLIVLARTSDVFGLLFFTLGIQAVRSRRQASSVISHSAEMPCPVAYSGASA